MEKKKVLVFGTFDGLHPGHLSFFEQAKAHGDELHIVVALDETVTAIKPNPPKRSQEKRLKDVQDLAVADSVRLGYEGDKYKIIEEIRPDVIALGYDQTTFTDQLQAELDQRGLQASIVRLQAFHPDKYKSSLLKDE